MEEMVAPFKKMQSATLAMDEMSTFVHSFIHSTTVSQLLLYARCLLATGRTTANTTDPVLVTLGHAV